ncbi:HNH endonuclease [Nocardioides sp. ChNu-153]|uniref:HNH endonuclease n=1 Tax=Nocardioides sp. ChNu-153 TaxID=2779364 RepID=UPI0026589732|nr:HNH endonuclease [Nocardioides sp. ChNu-153]
MPDTPKLKKTEWPVHITDALGIPSIRGKAGPWHSTGDTVDLAWFHAMCDLLGIDYPGERIRSMRAIIQAVGGTWVADRHSSDVPGKKAGGNVRREAFEDLWGLLHTSGLLTSEHRPAATDDPLQSLVGGQLPEPRWSLQRIRLRMGQPAFRARLLAAYGGRCAVTDTDVPETLEAAHIVAHADGGTTETSNGILLRADLHSLFDLRLIAVDTSAWTLVAHPEIRSRKFGQELHEAPLRLPAEPADRPAASSLEAHRKAAGF